MRIGGAVQVRINGKLYTIGEGEVTMNPGGMKREAKLSSGGVAGFTAKSSVPFLECDFIHLKELDVNELKDLEGVNVTADLYNGQTFQLHDAWCTGAPDVSSDGSIKIRFEGKLGEFV